MFRVAVLFIDASLITINIGLINLEDLGDPNMIKQSNSTSCFDDQLMTIVLIIMVTFECTAITNQIEKHSY